MHSADTATHHRSHHDPPSEKDPFENDPFGKDPFASLLTDFSLYWRAPSPPFDGSGNGGKVLNPHILCLNDQLCEAINHAPTDHRFNTTEIGTRQIRRALSDRDADRDVSFELKDGFGPQIGSFFRDGYENGDLDALACVMEENGWSGNPAKNMYRYPRPYVQRDTWLPDRAHLTDGHNDVRGLKPRLNIARVPDGLGADHRFHSPDYAKNASEGAFPSGHTNKAYSRGIVLAIMIPELAPEIFARVAEAENNRIVLGVHYPLDVIGGRVGGLRSVAVYLSQHRAAVDQARVQLWSYLEKRCRDAHLGSTLREAIRQTGCNDQHGYQSSFTDPVSPFPITDRASAFAAVRKRLTYLFSSSSSEYRPEHMTDSSWVPALAPQLLRYAYPQLSEQQKRTILARTALPAGCPCENSSHGWVRLDLARALSQKVMINEAGKVLSCIDWIEPVIIATIER